MIVQQLGAIWGMLVIRACARGGGVVDPIAIGFFGSGHFLFLLNVFAKLGNGLGALVSLFVRRAGSGCQGFEQRRIWWTLFWKQPDYSITWR